MCVEVKRGIRYEVSIVTAVLGKFRSVRHERDRHNAACAKTNSWFIRRDAEGRQRSVQHVGGQKITIGLDRFRKIWRTHFLFSIDDHLDIERPASKPALSRRSIATMNWRHRSLWNQTLIAQTHASQGL